MLKTYKLFCNPIKGDFDLKHLQAIHKFIFSDIYDWAGKLRTVNISKGDMFQRFDYLEQNCNALFDKLKSENYLMGLSQDELCKKLSYYLSEINVLHPFREGNGRTQRVFIEYLAKANGYCIDFTNVTRISMINACILAFNCEYSLMDKIITSSISPITFDEQYKFVKQITSTNTNLYDCFYKAYLCYITITKAELQLLKSNNISVIAPIENNNPIICIQKKDVETVNKILNKKLNNKL